MIRTEKSIWISAAGIAVSWHLGYDNKEYSEALKDAD